MCENSPKRCGKTGEWTGVKGVDLVRGKGVDEEENTPYFVLPLQCGAEAQSGWLRCDAYWSATRCQRSVQLGAHV